MTATLVEAAPTEVAPTAGGSVHITLGAENKLDRDREQSIINSNYIIFYIFC